MYFTEKLVVLSGTGANSDKIPVEISSLYDIDLETMTYTEIDFNDDSFVLGSTWDEVNGECTGFLKEVRYTVVTKNVAKELENPKRTVDIIEI